MAKEPLEPGNWVTMKFKLEVPDDMSEADLAKLAAKALEGVGLEAVVEVGDQIAHVTKDEPPTAKVLRLN